MTIEGDAFPRFVVHSTGSRLYMAEPTFAAPITPGSLVVLNLGHEQAQVALSMQGVGRSYLIASITQVDGTTDCNLNALGLLKNQGACASAKVTVVGPDAATYEDNIQLSIHAPTDMAKAAGFCTPMAMLAKPPVKPLGIINFLGNGPDISLSVPFTGIGSISKDSHGTNGVPCLAGGLGRHGHAYAWDAGRREQHGDRAVQAARWCGSGCTPARWVKWYAAQHSPATAPGVPLPGGSAVRGGGAFRKEAAPWRSGCPSPLGSSGLPMPYRSLRSWGSPGGRRAGH